MFAIRARRKVATERDFLDAVEKVVRQGSKFSSTYDYVLYMTFFTVTDQLRTGLFTRCIISVDNNLCSLCTHLRVVCFEGRLIFSTPHNGHDSVPCASSIPAYPSHARRASLNLLLDMILTKAFDATVLCRCKTASFAAGHRSFHRRRAPEPISPEVSKLLENYAQHPAQPLTLSSLLSYARPLTPKSVLASVEYVQNEIPRRLAARINSLEALPYIVGTNPYIARTLNAYRRSFVWLATQPAVKTLDENKEFTASLAALVEGHANDIPTMARGCALSVRSELYCSTHYSNPASRSVPGI